MKQLLVLCVFGMLFSQRANAVSNLAVQNLVQRIHAEVDQLSEQPILRFIPSPESPTQGQPFVVFISAETGYKNANILLSAKIDGQDAPLEEPTLGLWVFSHGGFNEIRSHDLETTLSIEDADEAGEIRQAINQLDKDITKLQKQIDQTPPGPEQDALIAQRDEKIALKTELLLALERLKTFVGTQIFSFQVSENPVDPAFPRITGVNPNVGSINGGTLVSVVGENFSSTPEVLVGGALVSATLVSSTEISFTTPAFSTLGAKDVELRFLQADGTTKNAILKNAFFAGVEPVPTPTPNFAPVAIAGPGQAIDLGSSATLDGTQSYDSNQDALAYSWSFVSVPEGSSLPTGVEISTSAQHTFTPNVPGIYVAQLLTRELNTSDLFLSEPSLTTVRVVAPANRAPTVSVTPSTISVAASGVASVTVATSDLDFWQKHTVLITRQPNLGTASLAGNTVTYTAGSVEGSDSVELTVVDNGDPQASATATLAISIASGNLPPVVVGINALQLTEGAPVRMRYSLLDGSLDPDGAIVRTNYLFSDAGSTFSFEPDNFIVTHDAVAFNPFFVTATAIDNLGASTQSTLNFDLAPYATNLLPVVRVVVDQISGAVPLTVNFDASATFDPEGQPLNRVQWTWRDGTADTQGSNEVLSTSHTFNDPGQYRVRLRVRDHLDGQVEHTIRIFAGVTPPAQGTPPTAEASFTPREALVGSPITFNGSRSNDPNPSGGGLSYHWSVGDWFNCSGEPDGDCHYATQSASHTYNFPANYFVSLKITNANGATNTSFDEVYAVNQGHAPRANFIPVPVSGAAPLTVNFTDAATYSYDYDGTLTNFDWRFGDGTPDTPGQTAEYTYTVPGVYIPGLKVTDNHGNTSWTFQMITVDPAYAKVRPLTNDDEDRAQRRRMLTNACGAGTGEACFELGKMVEEDGDTFTAQKLFERACSLGYDAACQIAKWMKW